MRSFVWAWAAYAVLLAPSLVLADESCPITSPREAAACALKSNPTALAERSRLDAMAGRRITASTLLPAHPELTTTVADRRLWQPTPGGPTPALNVYIALAQRIEVGGQRGLRLDVVGKETDAQLQRLAFVEL